MIITWQVEDGYAGPSRPHTTEINDGDLAECDTQEEWEQLISDSIDEDMRQRVYPVYKMPTWPGKKEETEDED